MTSTGTINITAGNAAVVASAVGAGIESSDAVSLTGGSLNFLNNAGATTKPAAATEAGNDAKVYGSLTLEAKQGNVTLGQAATTDKAASVLAVKVAKDIEATITAKDAVIVDNATFANEGKLKLVGTTNGVKFAADYTQGTGNSGKLDVIGASEFTGNVKFDSVMVGAARTTADAANNVVSESVLLNGAVTVKGTDKKAASFATGKLNITSGTFTVDSYATADLGEVAVSGADTSLAVNASGAATASKMTVSTGTLTVAGDLTVNKAADTPAVAAATDPVYDLTIGTTGNTVSVSGSLTAGSVLIGTAANAALTVSGTMQADSVTVQGDTGAATLTVSGAKSSATIGALNLNKSGTVSVGNSGAVVVTGDTVFAKDSTGDFTVNGTGAKVSLQNVTFAKDDTGTNKVNVQSGSVTIDGTLTANSGSLTIAGATAAATVNGKVVAAGSTKTGLVELTQGTLTLGSTADIGTETGAVKLTAGKLEAASALLLANQDSTVTDEAAKKKLLNKALGLSTQNTSLLITVTDEKLSSDQIVDLQTRINDKASGAAFAVTAITDSTGKEYTELFLRDDKATSPSFNISTLAGDVHLKNIDAKVNTDKSTTLASALTVGGAAGFAHNLGVQSLIFETTAPSTGATNANVTVDGKMLTLYGSLTDTAKELIQAYEYTDTTTKKVVPTAVTVQNDGKFVLGDDTAGVAQRYGNLNAEVTLTSGSMTVNNGVFTVKSLKTTANGSAAVAENANLTLKSLAGEAGAVTVSGNGVLTVESLATGANADVTLTGSAVAPTNTKAKVAKYFRLAEATSKTDAATTLGTVTRTGATQLVVGTADDSVLTKFMADNQYTYDYVDVTADPFSDIKHVDSATLIATNVNVAARPEMTGLTVFDMGSIVVEKDQLGNNKAIVRGGTVSGEIGLANVSGKSLTWDAKTGLGSVQLFDGTTTQTGGITIGDAMLDGTLVNGEAVVKVQNAEEVMPGFFLNKDMQRIYDEHLFDAASSDAQIAMLTQFSQAVNGMTSLGEIKAASQALEEGSNSAVLGGAYNAALDAGEQFNKALDRRMTVANGLNRAEGFTLWADVIGTSNQAKKLYGNSGYDLDLYGGVLGGDYTFAQYDATLGAALTVGTGSGGSKGTTTSIDNDVDFVGFSVYGNKRCPIVNSKFDLGYMQTKNDISAANSMGNWSSDVKAKAFTFGFGVELPTTVGIVNVTPHAGIRYTRLDVEGRDGLFGTDDDKLNVFQAPLGVTFSGAFETSGWNLAPTFDLSVVPAFGDKDATTKYNGLTTEVITRVVDSSPVQATLGLSAQKDAFTFGINYTLGAGSDERQNHSFNANVRYTF
ncbi:autotransporter domain-containing protein [Duodenibacillus massiliensis]|uniref:autotransporter domain-containing protein n=1 Tax=Duodenibacillus massiliensis TaxID=1852381 RepID=UPI00307ECB96